MKDPTHDGKFIVYYSSDHPHRRTNAAFLVVCFAMVELKRNILDAYAPFVGIDLAPFRDAAFAVNTFPLTVLAAARGVARAMAVGHFDPDKPEAPTAYRT